MCADVERCVPGQSPVPEKELQTGSARGYPQSIPEGLMDGEHPTPVDQSVAAAAEAKDEPNASAEGM